MTEKGGRKEKKIKKDFISAEFVKKVSVNYIIWIFYTISKEKLWQEKN